MKTLKSILLALIILFTLVGCDNSSSVIDDTNQNNNNENQNNNNNSNENQNNNNGQENNNNENSSNNPNNGGSDSTVPTDHTILTVYFSASSSKRTASVARIISSVTNSTLYEIVPAQVYTAADLNYNNSSSRSSQENSDDSARPAIGSETIDVSGYDVIFIGYPIWWAKAPKIIYTFLDTYDLSGKTVIPFATSSSTGIGGSERALHNLEPNATWLSGRLLNNASESVVSSWISSLNI